MSPPAPLLEESFAIEPFSFFLFLFFSSPILNSLSNYSDSAQRPASAPKTRQNDALAFLF
jgi:hypothetical protein